MLSSPISSLWQKSPCTISQCQPLFCHGLGSQWVWKAELWSTEKPRLSLEIRLLVRIQKVYPLVRKLFALVTHRERIKNKRQYIFSLNLFYFLELLLLTYYLQQLSFLASQRYVCEQLFIWFFCQKWPGQFIIIKELPPLVW